LMLRPLKALRELRLLLSLAASEASVMGWREVELDRCGGLCGPDEITAGITSQ
jgi:hypothetical protein